MSTPRQLWLLLAVFAGMATLEIALAARQSLWGDEVFSLAIATGHSLEHPAAAAKPALGDFVEPVRPVQPEQLQRYLEHDHPVASPARVLRAVWLSDTSPPFYYLLLYGWTFVFGTSDFILRFFSVVWSLACFPLFASIARRVAGRDAVLPACILFAVSPLTIYFSNEARMYSLLLFCVLVTAWVSLRLHERGGGLGLHALWIVASAAGFLTHYFFLFPWAAMVAFLILRPGLFRRSHLFVSVFLIGLAILPWYLFLPGSVGNWRVTGGWLHVRPGEYSRVRAARNQFVQFFSAGGSGLWPLSKWPARSGLLLAAIIMMTMAWRLRWRMFDGERLFVWLWFVAACIAPSLMDVLQHTYAANNPRYALAALPAAYLLAGIALSCMPVALRWTMLVLVAFAWAPLLTKIYRQHFRNSQPVCELGHVLQSTAQASDVILVHSIPSGVLAVARYTSAPLEIASWVQQLGTRRVPDSLPAIIGGRKRVLFVKTHLLGEPLPEEEWLRAHAQLVAEKHLEKIYLLEFRPLEAETF